MKILDHAPSIQDKNVEKIKYAPETRGEQQTQKVVAQEAAKKDHKGQNVKQISTHVWTPVQNSKNQCRHIPAIKDRYAAEQKQRPQEDQHGGSGYY